MLLTRSLKQKIAATCGAVFGFVLLYEVTMLDSKNTEARLVEVKESTAQPSPGLRLRFSATAYCKGTTTASGTAVRTGIVAADPDLLPVGSVIQIDSLSARYNGIYTVMDTGPKVQGRHLDLYMWSCNEALAFGRRRLSLNVLRLGWNPRASSPTSIQSQFHQREQDAAAKSAAGVPGISPDGAVSPDGVSPDGTSPDGASPVGASPVDTVTGVPTATPSAAAASSSSSRSAATAVPGAPGAATPASASPVPGAPGAAGPSKPASSLRSAARLTPETR